MNLAFTLAVVVASIGVVPLLIRSRFLHAISLWLSGTVVLTLLFYLTTPSLVWPLFGFPGFMVPVMWFLCAIIDANASIRSPYDDFRLTYTALFPLLGFMLFLGSGFSGCGVFRASEYAALMPPTTESEWTADVQPKDPEHVLRVPLDNAVYRSDKRLGEIPGAIGSQFGVAKNNMTLQRVNKELCYVAQIDFKNFSSWTSTQGTPGDVMISGENPTRDVIIDQGQQLRCTPGAYRGDDLERLLWSQGYANKGLTDFSYEKDDEQGKGWFVVTVYHPTIAWWGNKVDGVVIVDPINCTHKFYKLGQVPNWVDRVLPGDFIQEWLNGRGLYSEGLWNVFWARHNITKAEKPSIIYGADGEPYWVTGLTASSSDQSRVGLVYTNTRTGESREYHVAGNTQDAVLEAVNNKVKFRNLHGSDAFLYNIDGVMTEVVPLLGESLTWQGIAFVEVKNLQVALGDNQQDAYRAYQKLLASSGQQESLETKHDEQIARGKVVRIAEEVRGGETVRYLMIEGVSHFFVGDNNISPKFAFTQQGDLVEVRYIASGQDVETMFAFDNLSVVVTASPSQERVRERVQDDKTEDATRKSASEARDLINEMSDSEILELLAKSATAKEP